MDWRFGGGACGEGGGAEGREKGYNGADAARYADAWWDTPNPDYLYFEEDDCSNYVSQCLFAGGAPMHYTGLRESGWWFRGRSGKTELWSFSWAVAHALQHHLGTSGSGLRAQVVESPRQLSLGDVISYSWESARFGHSAIVTALMADGMPLVNAHSMNSRKRLWDYRDSYAWTEKTRYRFFHITI